MNTKGNTFNQYLLERKSATESWSKLSANADIHWLEGITNIFTNENIFHFLVWNKMLNYSLKCFWFFNEKCPHNLDFTDFPWQH